MQNQDNRPVKKIQVGAVSAALWRNNVTLRSGQEIESLSVTLDRRYKDKNGEWRSTTSLQANDVPKAVLALAKAFDYMTTRRDDEQPGVQVEEVM